MVVPFWTPITPLAGFLLHADPHSFTARVTLIAPRAGHDLTGNDQAMPEDTGIARRDDPIIGYAIKQHRLLIATASARLAFEAVYPA